MCVATPGRLLDHMRSPYVKFGGLEVLVLDEADRMLDMGFLPEIRKILQAPAGERQTLFFSATMPAPTCAGAEMLRNPVTIAIERKAAPAVGITQAAYPVSQELKSALLHALLARGDMTRRSCSRDEAPREPARRALVRAASTPPHPRQPSQAQRTAALAGFKRGSTRCWWRPTSPRAASTSKRSGTS